MRPLMGNLTEHFEIESPLPVKWAKLYYWGYKFSCRGDEERDPLNESLCLYLTRITRLLFSIAPHRVVLQ